MPPLVTSKLRSLAPLPKPLRLQLPAHWNYQHIEYRFQVLWTLAAVPALRYTQDRPEERKKLFVRDFSALGSSTMTYLMTQRVLQRALEAAGMAEGAKRRFFTYIPAQVVSLLTSAFLGPKVSNWVVDAVSALKQSRQVTPTGKPQAAPVAHHPKEMAAAVAAGAGVAGVANKVLMPLAREAGRSTRWWQVLYNELPVWVTSLELGVFTGNKLRQALKKSHPTDGESNAHISSGLGGALPLVAVAPTALVARPLVPAARPSVMPSVALAKVSASVPHAPANPFALSAERPLLSTVEGLRR